MSIVSLFATVVSETVSAFCFFFFSLLPVPGVRLVVSCLAHALKTLLPSLVLASMITCRYCVILQRKPTNLPAPVGYGTLLARHVCARALPAWLLVDVPVCAQLAQPGLSGGQALAASIALTAVPSRKLEAMHPTYAVQLFAIPCNGLPACLSCLSCRLSVQLYLGYHLPALDNELVRPNGAGPGMSIAGRRDLMSPSPPGIGS